MYTVFLAGGIASGKSTVGRALERRGAWRIDLDRLSRAVLEPGSPCVAEVADAFGEDLVDAASGALMRGLLAKRAFADAESAARLEAIELPYIRELLVHALEGGPCGQTSPAVCVVEVPLLDRMESMLDFADEVLVVDCPLELRRVRAIGRGMEAADFDRRAANQPSDECLREHATTILDNTGGPSDLAARIDAWWVAREANGWEANDGE
ncbi:dephospho-CoA kinase [Paratractidigestivibacter sp.]|uniref:dephospho-CoA kinase n=1 Tax=Paratractidigestivibacter sp. TaxID=2847316 RepID=UPI002ABD7C8C|nr:dephospho-CoA kinase [Paratractidigestivibacter sp.]